MSDPLTPDEVTALLPPPDIGDTLKTGKDWLFDHPEAVIVIVPFALGLLFLVLLKFSGCWGVPIAEERYCKRIGYEAYEAKRDTAYWAHYGMQP